MSIGEQILNKMIKEGADIPEGKKLEVAKEVEKAIEDKHFLIIEKDGKDIGFLTYFEKPDGIFVNNCIIYKNFRGIINLIYLRKFFREKYKGLKFYWRSKKRGAKLCIVK